MSWDNTTNKVQNEKDSEKLVVEFHNKNNCVTLDCEIQKSMK